MDKEETLDENKSDLQDLNHDNPKILDPLQGSGLSQANYLDLYLEQSKNYSYVTPGMQKFEAKMQERMVKIRDKGDNPTTSDPIDQKKRKEVAQRLD
jgi:hypothetical protein